MVLDAHGRYGDPTLWFLFDGIEDANVAQSQLPGGYWIRANTFRFRVGGDGS